ncbi:MAG: hypothetical protein L3J30_02520 [Marinosulfonomonas sp.]|nr:hypothetical protein [Marinosulfonomonas sp.]
MARGVWKDEARALWSGIAPFPDQVTDPAQMTMARYTHGTLMRPYGTRLATIGAAKVGLQVATIHPVSPRTAIPYK